MADYSNGLKLLDMMPTGYDKEYVNSLFTMLGEEGRHSYLFNQIPVDMIYPFLFGISYCLLLAYFLNKLNKFNSSHFYLCLLPLAGGAADYIENIGIIKMLNDYPDVSYTSVIVTNIFSIIKSMTTTIYFLALVIVLIAFGIQATNENESMVD